MTDSRLHSLHLEGLANRRDEFRAARQQLQVACGEYTLVGDLPLLSPNDPGDGPTLVVPFGLTQTYWLNDGDKSYPLSVGINTIGRLADNSVVIRDEHVSRRHCAIVVHRDGSCEVHDVASKNGTILSGRKISGPTRIRSGDELTLCGRKLRFTIKFTDDGPTQDPA